MRYSDSELADAAVRVKGGLSPSTTWYTAVVKAIEGKGIFDRNSIAARVPGVIQELSRRGNRVARANRAKRATRRSA